MTEVNVSMVVNGREVERSIPSRMLLSDFLRQELHLTGTHVGCELGSCGCCNVLIDGRTARSCLTLAAQTDGSDVRTVEDLGTATNMHPLQEAFWEEHGLQCGFCTPGVLNTARELLEKNPSPTREEVVEGLSGNLCRCTGYHTIINAVMVAAEKMSGRGTAS